MKENYPPNSDDMDLTLKKVDAIVKEHEEVADAHIGMLTALNKKLQFGLRRHGKNFNKTTVINEMFQGAPNPGRVNRTRAKNRVAKASRKRNRGK